MKYIIAIFLVILCSSAVYAQDTGTDTLVSTATDTAMPFTWSKVIQMQPGDQIDIIKECQPGFVNAWCNVIGTVQFNGDVTTFISWCANSTVKALAISSATITIQGS